MLDLVLFHSQIWVVAAAAALSCQKDMPYRPDDPATPEWARAMYSADPNVYDVDRAYEEYFATHEFEKSYHTQYYKRWRRQVQPYVDQSGAVKRPSSEELRQSDDDYYRSLQNSWKHRSSGTWEFVGPEGGSQSVLSGGGRYDGLAEELGGPPTPGVGFGAGIERLLIALEAAGTTEPADEGIDVFFVCGAGADRAAVLAKVMELRKAGVQADADFAGRSVKGQRTQAGRLGAKKVVVVEAGTDLAAVTA